MHDAPWAAHLSDAPIAKLYWRIALGTPVYDRELYRWARELAWLVADARHVRKRGEWIDWAGHDALWYAINHRWPVSASARVGKGAHERYERVRNAVAGGMLEGLRAQAGRLCTQKTAPFYNTFDSRPRDSGTAYARVQC